MSAEIETVPGSEDIEEQGRYPPTHYYQEFGWWSDAINAAGLKEEGTSNEPNNSSGVKEDTELVSQLTGSKSNVCTWDDIPDSRRLPSPIAVRILREESPPSNKVDGLYRVEDLDGKEFELKIWETHGIQIEWKIDTWYLLTEARGKAWEKNGQEYRLLSSTKDLQAVYEGAEPPSESNLP